MTLKTYFTSLALSMLLAVGAYCQELTPEIHGAGWLQMGRVVESSSEKGRSNDYTDNWMQNAGGQLSATLNVDDHWQGGLSIGVIQVHLARGSKTQASLWYPFWVTYVGEARITYSNSLFTADDKWSLTMGSFGYNYNPDVKNLGLYMMRGYVYPGALVSGFGNIYGARAGYEIGMLSNDLLFNIETEDKPLYDISIADYLNFKFHPGFEFGLGVNFYRLIPQNSDVTSPTKDCDEQTDISVYGRMGQDNACFLFDSSYTVTTDPLTGQLDSTLVLDTITGSLAGTKMVMRFRLDPKALAGGIEALGENDLVIYGEAAILGTKNYSGEVYGSMSERMPIMVGMNLPTFGFMNLSVEVEHYGSKNSSDNLAAQNGSWVPPVKSDVDNTRDDWKWAVNASKGLFGNMALSAQVANDHLRLGGSHNIATGVETTTTPSDWYWTAKLAYFF
ncbi:hypothetical protein ACFL5V_07420 [Fibrobacterota bacterium]